MANIASRFNKEHRPGYLVGKDLFGNHFFEVPADPSRGIRNPRRWFKTTDPDAWDRSLAPEWEAWLRYRRDTVPTEEEVRRNMVTSQVRKEKAKVIKERFQGTKETPQQPDTKYNRYPEYQETPGGGVKHDANINEEWNKK